MEYFDIVDEYGEPTGETVSRETAHRDGILHRTSHVWIVRQTKNGYEILLQKRSMEKDSYPGMYDTSSAGHIPAGNDPLESALRELQEELGIDATPHQLTYAGMFHGQYAKEFHGKMFRDNEIAHIYVYQEEVEIKDLRLQKSEVEEVRWFDLDEVWDEIFHQRGIFCVPTEGLRILRKFLGCRNRIGILSDTHGLLRDEVKAILDGCDVILHGGDIDKQEILSQLQQIAPNVVVRGNNDKEWAKDIPEYLKISLDGLSIYMTHKKKDLPKDLSHYDLVVYGHSHRYEEKHEGHTVLLNPGSCGPRRFHQDITMAYVKVKQDGNFQITRVDIPQKPGITLKNEKNLKSQIERTIQEIKKGKSVEQIAKKLRIEPELAEQICRLYLTHPGVDADGILTKMGL